jgi:predicted secreted hydrolase
MLDLRLQATQALLLQGDAGFSRKGPEERQASHYYSAPQLAVQAEVRGAAPTPATAAPDARAPGKTGQSGGTAESAGGGATRSAASAAAPWHGRGWLDHEWSDELMHPRAVGWDWVGLNLFDGSALTAFVLRRADGSVLWAGGSWRTADGTLRVFAPDEVRFSAGRRWTSPATAAVYPVQWRIDHPAGPHTVNALLDAQELDSRGSTGAVYWEGLSEVLDGAGRRVGLGYLEMTGYVGALRL